MDSHTVIIGVDGGATEAKAHLAICDNTSNPTAFELGEAAASRKYPQLDGFQPVPVAEQFAQRDAGEVQLSDSEKKQGSEWVDSACQAVAEVAKSASANSILVGMGMPGLKTPDGRGIAVINNGPRIPDYLERLERSLTRMGLRMSAPVASLGSDADYCGLGELHAAEGMFRSVENAYYIGCGTGIADAMKLRGRLITFDAAKPWIQKAWQIPSPLGETYEKLISAKSMNDRYAAIIGANGSATSRFPEVDAANGQIKAITWMNTVAMLLAELIFERVDTIRNGRRAEAHRGKAYAELNANHPYRGTMLDCVVVGQRIGQIYANPDYRSVFGEKLEECLAANIVRHGDSDMIDHYLEGGRLRQGVLLASKLRAAPALGAAVAAVQASS